MKLKTKTDEMVVVLFLTVLFTVFTLTPIIINYQTVPEENHYWGNDSFALDTIGTLAIMRKGYEGHWQGFLYHWKLPDQESQNLPDLVKLEYLVLGHIARIVNMDILTMFYVSRAVLSMILFVVMYWFITKLLSSRLERVVAYTLTLFATGISFPWQQTVDNFPILLHVSGSALAFNRYILESHHYLLGHIFTLVSLYYLSRALKERGTWRDALLATASILIVSFTFLPSTLMVLATLPVYLVLQAVIHKRRIAVKRSIRVLVPYVIVAVLPALYLMKIVEAMYPTEHLSYLAFDGLKYLLTIGLVYIAALGVFKHLNERKNDTLFLLLVPWLVVHPILTMVVERFDFFSVRRLFQTTSPIVFGILAAISIVGFAKRFGTRKQIVALGITAIILASSALSYKLDLQPDCFCNGAPYDYGYPKKTFMSAVLWLRDNTDPTDRIMTGYHAGTMAQAFSGNDVTMSWWLRLGLPMSYDILQMKSYFGGKLKSDGAMALLRNYDVDYVFYGPEEQFYHYEEDAYLPYEGLIPVYENEDVVIYKVP